MVGILDDQIKEAFWETIPFEFSIVDRNDKVAGWNKHETRLFKRPRAVLGKDVRNCHPPKSLGQVEQILNEMKSGQRDKARFWIGMNVKGYESKRKILIEYFALRDNQKNYLGCLEVTRDITDLQQLHGEKRLMDV